MTKFKRISVLLFVFAMLLQTAPAVFAKKSSALTPAVVAKIRKEAMENSQIMNTLHMYTDVYGPRLTGSPNLEAAGKWSMKQMKEWGFDRVEMEPWDFGSPGWANQRAIGSIVSPMNDVLDFEVLAWTPGTNGIVTAEAVALDTPRIQNGDNPKCLRSPTRAELDAYLASIAGKVRGGIVLAGSPRSLGVNFNPPAKRLSDEVIAARRRGGPRRRPTPPANNRPKCPKPEVATLSGRQIFVRMNQFLSQNKPAVRINDSRMRHGTIRAFGNRRADPATTPPTVVMRNEDYGRVWRLLKGGHNVKLEFYIKNTYYPKGATSYNTIGEIAGRGKTKDEVIMMGGHLDSWHSATGATDNGIGCAIMMEAGRILKAIGVKPKRTIRIALWSGEEQGLLGSRAYVAKHFGTAENPKPAYKKFGGYFNVDSGTGMVRGWSVFGPDAAGKILNDALAGPFKDVRFEGANNTTSRRLGGSDHTSFNQAGLPGIGALQDPIEYFTTTWHTNLDTYERIVEDDVKATAALVAAGVYELAMRDELLPRFSKTEMPRAPAPRGR
ncbi:MAG: M20/M25/M40 family metallo-hydrolase [Pyrinomonadaceae bacterium]|nr:M20/M25/M40 family metallo-hydrolase [Pyrinomonadaceae bacterium]